MEDEPSLEDKAKFFSAFNQRLLTDYKRKEDLEDAMKLLAKHIADDMKSKYSISSETHFTHHDKDIPLLKKWVEEKIKMEIEQKETALTIKRDVLKTVVLIFIGGLLTVLGLGISEYVKHYVESLK
jgi:hypothetical protein